MTMQAMREEQAIITSAAAFALAHVDFSGTVVTIFFFFFFPFGLKNHPRTARRLLGRC